MSRDPTNLIGAVATYNGTGHPHLRGHTVRVFRVIRRPGGDPDAGRVIYKNDELAAVGGVNEDDVIEVHVWLPTYRRFGFVQNDVRLGDLHDLREKP